MLRRALVVGASSGIGEALVRRLARDGYLVAAVARREDRLNALVASVNGEGTKRAFAFASDVRDADAAKATFDAAVAAMDGLDLIVYAAGVMPEVALDEFDNAKDREIVEINVIGAMNWLNLAAARFLAQGRGTIVGIGSVAGDRGRLGNPGYCASKAALHTYLESLRNRLARHGVSVVTIKPGPVRTPMTEGRDKLPLLIEADAAADAIVRAAQRGAVTAYVPFTWWPIMSVIRAIPSVIFRRMSV